jgi:hypothetical protein
MFLTLKQKEKHIIELRKKEYNYKDIAHELRVSVRDVSRIVKAMEREEDESRDKEAKEIESKEKKRQSLSNRSKALKLYKKGKNPVDVSIQLDISPEEAKNIHLEYLSLENHSQFILVYKELENNDTFKAFIDLFFHLKDNSISREEIAETIKMKNELPNLRKEYAYIHNKISEREEYRIFLIEDNKFLKDQNDEIEMRLNSTSKQIDTNRVVSKKLDKKIRQKRELLYELHSSEDYSKARNKVKLMVNDLLNDNKKVLSLAITYCFDALKKVLKKEILTKSLLSSNEENISSIETVLLQEKLREIAENLYYDISDRCTDNILNA